MALTPDQLHDQIRAFLSMSEPVLMRLLYGAWDRQIGSVTYADLARGAREGTLTPATLADWQLIYNNVVVNQIIPLYKNAGLNGFNVINSQLGAVGSPSVPWDDFRVRLDRWVDKRGGELITNLNKSQSKAVNQILKWHISNEPLTPTELGIRLRSSIGLTAREEQAVRRRLQLLLDTDGVTRAAAFDQATQYGGYLHRIRATRIARTEMATAYNQGQQDTILTAVDEGLIDGAQKCWLTAEDERVCVQCEGLDGDCVDLKGEFTQGGSTVSAPPIHPSCRCVLLYEIEDEDDQ